MAKQRKTVRPVITRFLGGLGKAEQPVKEIIGRVMLIAPVFNRIILRNVDETVMDYRFWDLLRRGKAPGFEIAGLFCQPITQTIASFVLGKGLSGALSEQDDDGDDENDVDPEEANEPLDNDDDNDADDETPIQYTNKKLSEFFARHKKLFAELVDDLYSLGDQYVINNMDGSLSIASPETAEVDYDDIDYHKPVKFTFTTKGKNATVTDVYTEEYRELTVKYNDTSRGTVTQRFPNLIGKMAVTHLKNDASANEQNGRPIYEPLYHVLAEYDDLLQKGLDGTKLAGSPIPTLEGVENINETIRANSEPTNDTYENEDGDEVTRERLRFDRNAIALVGKGGSFKFVGPTPGFTTDILAMLRQLFVLIMNFSRIPEFLWGGAISSSKASAETQDDPFFLYIEARRTRLEGDGASDDGKLDARGGFLQIADNWLRIKRLTDPKIVVGPVTLDWPELATENMQIKLQWVQWLANMGWLRAVTAVDASELVDDPQGEVDAAKAEREAEQAANPNADTFQAAMTKALGDLANTQGDGTQPANNDATTDNNAATTGLNGIPQDPDQMMSKDG